MLATLGERAFQSAALHLWNELTLLTLQLSTIRSVRTFRIQYLPFLAIFLVVVKSTNFIQLIRTVIYHYNNNYNHYL